MRILFMTSVLACLCNVSLSLAQTKPATLQTYTSDQHGFKIQYLSIWQVKSPGSQPWVAVSFTAPEGSDKQSRAAVAMPPLKDHKKGDPIKLEEIAQALVDEMKADMPNVTVVIATDTKLGGEPARRMILTGHSAQANSDMRMLVVAAAHKDVAYVVGVMAPKAEFERSREGFDELIGTFQFTK